MSGNFHNKGKLTITDSAVAIGAHSRATNSVGAARDDSPEEAELRAELARLVERLRGIADELADRETVSGAADAVAEELAAPATRWQRIKDVLGRVAPSVAALTQLATDVGRLEAAAEALIPH
ncbi:hypothetical protein ABTY61_26845 [Kitasatospora sp. NPDC096128]|uniref:hypothetical protein n=1 Tax=Kitasatospora sp. NPDC096128 TaxID=3155547 RepID=UPI003332D6C7